jgi:hypothetical protein
MWWDATETRLRLFGHPIQFLNPYHNMLQLIPSSTLSLAPSSVLSLLSFPSNGFFGLFGGFYLAVQVTASVLASSSNPSFVPKTFSVAATRTIESVLVPTKCVPSYGTITSWSYTALFAYYSLILVSLFFILLAKGFLSPSNHNAVGSQPPSPPPDPGSVSVADKAHLRRRWLWLLYLLSLLVALLGLGRIYMCFVTSPVSPWIQSIRVLERCFPAGLRALASIVLVLKSDAIRRYSTVFLLVITSCFGVFVAKTALLRLAARVPTRSDGELDYAWAVWLLCGLTVILASFPQLNWIIWVIIYFFSPFWSLCASNIIPPSFYYRLIDEWYSFSLVDRSASSHSLYCNTASHS